MQKLFNSGPGATNKPNSAGGSSSTTPKISVQGIVLSEAQMLNHTHDGMTEIEDNNNIYYDIEAVLNYIKYVSGTTCYLHFRGI
jgi:hypothetical protein